MIVQDSRNMKIRIPKSIARITLCGAISIEINDDVDCFVFPTEEQRRNLKEILCIDVEDLRQKGGGNETNR